MKKDSIVHIVEDDTALQNALRMLVQSVGLEHRIFGTAQQFLDQFDPDSTGCLVTDVRLPGMSGLELQKVLRERQIVLPVVIITGHGDIPMAVEAVQQGAIDFIEKPFRDQRLLDAIQRALAAGEEKHLERARNQQTIERLARLTTRQRQVLDKMITGKPNKIIADELELSIKTIEFHRSQVMKNMNAGSLAELVHMTTVTNSVEGKP